MKSLRQSTAAGRFATADLFADVAVVAPCPAPITTPSTAEPTTVQPATTPSTAEPATARPRNAQLWYAVVFPELPESRAACMLQRLCVSAQRFTSWVSIEMPNALLLEIKGSVKLFGSLEALHADIDAAWSRLELCARTATAPTTLGALWLARAGKHVQLQESGALAGALAELPIACTAWHPDRLQTLRSMGVTRMGELLRLPRAGLARRLGPAAVVDVDIALAKQAAPRRAFVSRERFRERCDFETEIDTVGYLQKAVHPLIERCALFLRQRQAGVQALELRLRHRALAQTWVRSGLSSITGERRRLADVLDEKLQRLELRAPVRSMELRSGVLQPLSASSQDAFAGLRDGGRDTAPQLVERLRARLGEHAVYGVMTIAEHRPEAAWQRVDELRLTGAQRAAAHAGAAHGESAHAQALPRPVWLLAEPEMLRAADLQRLREGALILEEGPERIESGWWDGRGVARDYYIARQAHGARWWIFQERHTHEWYLHGVFA
jgi:protein ImuB